MSWAKDKGVYYSEHWRSVAGAEVKEAFLWELTTDHYPSLCCSSNPLSGKWGWAAAVQTPLEPYKLEENIHQRWEKDTTDLTT